MEIDGALVVLAICLLNLLPVAYELTLSALLSSGVDVTRARWFGPATRSMNAAGVVGEYGLTGVVVAFITTAIFLHVTAFYPFFDQHAAMLPWLVLHVAPSVLLNSGMLINFAHCCVRSPGTTTPGSRDDLPGPIVSRIEGKLGPLDTLDPTVLEKALKVFGIRWCAVCNASKPAHAHHCSTCGVCVLRLDHHCPFVSGKCIGKDNLRFFYAFMTHTVGATLYAMVLTWPSFHACFWAPPSADAAAAAGTGTHIHHSDDPTVMHAADPRMDALCEALGARNRLLFLVAVGSFCVLGSLHGYMTYLMLHRLTMLENMPFFASKRAASDTAIPGLDAAKGWVARLVRRVSWYRSNLVFALGPVSSWWRWFFPLADLVRAALRREIPGEL